MSRHIYIDHRRNTADKLREVAKRMTHQLSATTSLSLAAHAAILFAHERQAEFAAFIEIRDECKPKWGNVGGLKR